MGIDDLPIIEEPLAVPLKIVERAEISFRGGLKCMAYVAGRTKEGRIIYDTAVISGKDGLYIERLHQRDEDISEITSYILLRPLLMIVPVRK